MNCRFFFYYKNWTPLILWPTGVEFKHSWLELWFTWKRSPILTMSASLLGLTETHLESFMSSRPPTWSWWSIVRKSLSVCGTNPYISADNEHGGYRFNRRKHVLSSQETISSKSSIFCPKFSISTPASHLASFCIADAYSTNTSLQNFKKIKNNK